MLPKMIRWPQWSRLVYSVFVRVCFCLTLELHLYIGCVMVSTKWCLMHCSGSVSPRCGCPLSLALLLLADWTKPSRGQHIRTSSRPEGGPIDIEGFMTGTPRGPRSYWDVQHGTVSLWSSVFPSVSPSLTFSQFFAPQTKVYFRVLQRKKDVFVSVLLLLVQQKFKVCEL